MRTLAHLTLTLVVGGCALVACSSRHPDATRPIAQEELTAWSEASASRVREALGSHRLSATLLTRIHLERIAKLDPALKSILATNPDAVRDAEALDRTHEMTGQVEGPLHGVPVIVKDNIDVAEQPTTAGCKALSAGYPVDDAFVIARLRAAGAVILGKANLSELAAFTPRSRSSLGGDTVNAYDRERSPLGSSGGTATAVSANLALVGLGTDTNGSVLYPAAASGLVGVRPTVGLVSRDGVVAGFDETTTVGPMARSVADAALLLDVIAGSDPADPSTAEAAAHLPKGGYVAAIGSVPMSRARLGTSADFLHSSEAPYLGTELDPDVERLTAEVLARMRAAGATVVDVGSLFAVMAPMLPAYAAVVSGEALNTHHELNRYLAHQRSDAPVRSVEEILESGDFLPDIKSTLEEIVAAPETSSAENPATQRVIEARRAFRERVVALMDQKQVDVLVYPTMVRAAGELDTTDLTAYGASAGLSTQTGLPAVTVMLGFDRQGMPLGLTFLGRPWDEARLLAIAHAYETLNPVRRAPPDRF
jgi:Asp-tRNA(Asn)/Glu-tRNA(Gln) amidotransferase A subunit family amidase